MYDIANVLSKVLEAREKRAFLRMNLTKYDHNTLSLSLNIPGYPKTNSLISNFFEQILDELKIYLIANRIQITPKKEKIVTDEAGNFYITTIPNQQFNLQQIKELTENFEENHILGRLIDIDIFDTYTIPVSSGKNKLCYYCGNHPAILCMRENRHTYTEIRNKIFEEVSTYLKSVKKEYFIKKISSIAQKALLYETALTPKPGLVDFDNAGSHPDMNYFKFLNSSAAISAYFREFCLLGYNFSGNYDNVLPQIRQIGLRAEKSMYEATENINTQKGLIFLFGICLFAISKIAAEDKEFSLIKFRETIKETTKDIVKNELLSSLYNKTHGEKVFQRYGDIGAGVRYEVENGLPTIFETAIPYFNENLTPELINNQTKLQKILQIGLLKIMSINNDTNIIFRSDLETLKYVKKCAIEAIINFEEYEKLCTFCVDKNISPGGSADLLAVSLLIHFANDAF